MSTPSIPESLRQVVGGDFQPVRPLRPVWMRLLAAIAVTATGLTAMVAAFELSVRPDMGNIPMWLGWGCTAVQLIVGVVLIGMALRESIPGNGVPAGAVAVAVGAGVVMQVLVGIATWMHSPGVPYDPGRGLATGFGCASHDLVLGLPALAVTFWLVFRALPLRPSIAGLLGGTGAGVTADAINHIVCPMSDLRHVLVWHTGVIFGLMLAGWLVGLIWQRKRFGRS